MSLFGEFGFSDILLGAISTTLQNFKDLQGDLKGFNQDDLSKVTFKIDTDAGIKYDSKVTITGYDQAGNQIGDPFVTYFERTFLSVMGDYTGTNALINAWGKYAIP